MGAMYEVRWSVNNACPISQSIWTNNLVRAIVFFVKAVVKGYTSIEMKVHDWTECKDDCEYSSFCPKKEE